MSPSSLTMWSAPIPGSWLSPRAGASGYEARSTRPDATLVETSWEPSTFSYHETIEDRIEELHS